jgi:hypothetical protein
MSARAADLIETNFVEFLLSMGRAGGAVERLDDEIAWTIGGSPIGYHNAVVRCTASEGRSASSTVGRPGRFASAGSIGSAGPATTRSQEDSEPRRH